MPLMPLIYGQPRPYSADSQRVSVNRTDKLSVQQLNTDSGKVCISRV